MFARSGGRRTSPPQAATGSGDLAPARRLATALRRGARARARPPLADVRAAARGGAPGGIAPVRRERVLRARLARGGAVTALARALDAGLQQGGVGEERAIVDA